MNFQLGGISPLEARASLPIGKMLLIGLLIILAIFGLWFISKKIIGIFHSEKYLLKQKVRITTRKDVAKYARDHALSDKKEALLWEVCNLTKIQNINYSINTSNDVIDFFRDAYNKIKEKGVSEEKLNEFFLLEYRIETIIALSKGISSTKLLPVGKVVFYITETSEQFPLYIIKNDENGLSLEIPEFLFRSPRRPKVLSRQKFNFKTDNGLCYNFLSRAIRYEESNDGQFLMIIAHCDQLVSTTQRQYKRENYEANCHISPIQINTERKDGNVFLFSNKVYPAKLTNISAGGCCLHNALPIKENQHICVLLNELGINEKIVGVIKSAGKTPMGEYALHIQFLRISPAARNRIFALIYKYEI